MKFLVGLFSVLSLSFLFQQFFPWWVIAVVSVIIGFLLKAKGGSSFLYGFLGIFLLWSVWAYFIDHSNESLLSTQIGALFGGLSPILMILVTGLIGGLVGGMSAMTGTLGRRLMK